MSYNGLIEKLRDPEALALCEQTSFNDSLALWLAMRVTSPSVVDTSRLYGFARYEGGRLCLSSTLSDYKRRELRACFTDKRDLDAVDRLYMKSLELKKMAGELRDIYNPLLYLNRYYVEIASETATEFSVELEDGSIYGINDIREEDADMDFASYDRYEKLGFSVYDRGIYDKTLKKISPDIKGEWLKLVRYRGWVLRAIHEEAGRYLLLAKVGRHDGARLGMTEVPDALFHIKWVDQGECADLSCAILPA